MASFGATTLRIKPIFGVHALSVGAEVRFGVHTILVVLLAAIPIVQVNCDWLIVFGATQGTPFSHLGVVRLIFAVRVGSISSYTSESAVALLRADGTHQFRACSPRSPLASPCR